MSTAGSRAFPDAEAGEAGEQSFSGTPTAEPLKRNCSHSFFQSTTTAVRQAFQVRRLCKSHLPAPSWARRKLLGLSARCRFWPVYTGHDSLPKSLSLSL